jgi:hypothetical protein
LHQLKQQQQEERHMLDKKKVWSQVWRPKSKADDEKYDGSVTSVVMVFLLPKEFMAPIDFDRLTKNRDWLNLHSNLH